MVSQMAKANYSRTNYEMDDSEMFGNFMEYLHSLCIEKASEN